MREHSVYLLCLFFLFSNFTCNNCEEEFYGQSSYTAEIIPMQVNYNVGDTILLGTSFPALIPLDDSNDTYDSANKPISYTVQIFEVRPNNETVVDGIEDFEISTRSGYIESRPLELAVRITDSCSMDTCGFQIAVVPKEKGIYCFSLLNGYFGETECEHFSLAKNDFGTTNNNFEICNEINTVRFRVKEGGVFFSYPQIIRRFYFFKVE